jgi:hypothetical protein
VSAELRDRTYGLYCRCGMALAAFLALTREQRNELAAKFPAPAPEAKPEQSKAPTPKADRKPDAPKGNAKPQTAGLEAYRKLKAECKAAGLETKGTADQLRQRLEAHKANPAPQTVKLAAVPQTAEQEKAKPGVLYVADGKGGYRPATEAEVWAILDGMSKAKAAA